VKVPEAAETVKETKVSYSTASARLCRVFPKPAEAHPPPARTFPNDPTQDSP
jgi:hypothetical protein